MDEQNDGCGRSEVSQITTETDPSRPLFNRRHEKFANLVSAGQPAYKAFLAAGFTAKNDDIAFSNASRLIRIEKVRARIRFLSTEHDRLKMAAIAEVVKDDVRTAVGRVRALEERRNLLIDMIQRMRLVVSDRSRYVEKVADGQSLPDLPGTGSGLIISGFKSVGKRAIRTHELDRGLLASIREYARELRETERQIAVELGQWNERVEITNAVHSADDIPVETLERWRAEIEQFGRTLN